MKAKVVRGLNLTDAGDQCILTCALLSGSAKKLHPNHIEPLALAARNLAVANAVNAAAAAVEQAKPLSKFYRNPLEADHCGVYNEDANELPLTIITKEQNAQE